MSSLPFVGLAVPHYFLLLTAAAAVLALPRWPSSSLFISVVWRSALRRRRCVASLSSSEASILLFHRFGSRTAFFHSFRGFGRSLAAREDPFGGGEVKSSFDHCCCFVELSWVRSASSFRKFEI